MKHAAALALLFLALGILPVSAQERWMSLAGRDHALAGQIWDVAQSVYLTEAQLIERLAAAAFVLLGETHDNPDHHRLQARMVAGLAPSGRFGAVAFEMLDTAQAPALARHLEQKGVAEGLGRAVGWRRWPDWRQNYQPIAEAALAAGMIIIAGNLPDAVVRRAAAEGQAILGADFVARTGLEEPLSEAAQRTLEAELIGAHCGMDVGLVSEMVTGQRIWDAAMGDALARTANATGKGVILIAGSGHTRNDRAVPVVLGRLRPNAVVAALAFIEVAVGFSGPRDYAPFFLTDGLPYDYVWFTPGKSADALAAPCG